jgi:hypothetical protein
MLKIKHEDELSQPIICCDVCNKEITNAQLAMVYWNDKWSITNEHEGVFKVLVMHKGCNRKIDSQQTRLPYSMELQTFMMYLLNNCGLSGKNFEDAQQIAQLTTMM